ncbi:MAG TPA: hypothetical protein VH142_12030 [Polyangiaceae bacterium]|nr:hypothetical protein [Polyangiaceae bacterium]
MGAFGTMLSPPIGRRAKLPRAIALGTMIGVGVLAAATLTLATAEAQTPPKLAAPPAKPKPAPAAPAVAPPAVAPAAAPAAAPTAASSTTAAPVAPVGRLTLDGLALRVAERQKTIDARRLADQQRIQVRWGALVNVPAVHEELKQHAERLALLGRIVELGQVEGKIAVIAGASRAMARENVRHERQMQALAAAANTPVAGTGGAS